MPFYQFNNFTGRLKEPTHLQPLYPLSPTQLQSNDPPKMVYDTVNTKPATTVRAASTSSGGGGVLPSKMLKTFEEMQRNLDLPVYNIRGKPDKILNGICYSLIGVGLLMGAEFIYKSAFPPSNR